MSKTTKAFAEQVQVSVQTVNNGVVATGPDGPTYYRDHSSLFEDIVSKSFNPDMKDEEIKKSMYPNLLGDAKYDNGFQINLLVSELPKEAPVLTKYEEGQKLLREVIDSQKEAPEVDATDIRLSVNENNAYSAEVLSKKYDFMKLKKNFGFTTKRLAEIVGKSEMALYQNELSIKKGIQKFSAAKIRVDFTVLAKYYDRLSGKKSELVSELAVLQDAVEVVAMKMRLVSLNNHVLKGAELEDLVDTLFSALRIPNKPNKGMVIEALKHRK